VRLTDLLDEIKELAPHADRRSASAIHNMLVNHKKVFLTRIEAEDYSVLVRDFRELDETHPKDYGTETFKREYAGAVNRLVSYLSRSL
jgi:hypothetical protein